MLPSLHQVLEPARELFRIVPFESNTERRYIAFRDELAAPILRFAFYIGGAITLLLTLIELVVDKRLSTVRLAYLVVWLIIFFRRPRSTDDTIKVYCVYFCTSIVFFIYHYYFILQRPAFLVAVVNLMATAIIVAKIGARLSRYIALFIPGAATLILLAAEQPGAETGRIWLLLCLTAVVIWLASIILEKSSREQFRVMEALETSRKKERQASDARMNFLAFMSHEIRTPLTAIIGYAESVLEDDIAPSNHTAFIRRIKTNGDHLLRLVNDILDLSKIEQGKFLLNEDSASLFDLLQDVQYATENLASRKHLQLSVNYVFPLPHEIRVDKGRLVQVLVNLVGNGIKFTEQGSVALHVSASGKLLRFSVIDTGIGISDEAAQRIFTSFEQENADITRRYGGTGLGLTISRHLATLMGGELTFSSELDKGSTFTVTVALNETKGTQWVNQVARSQSVPVDVTNPISLTGRVLVADDVADNRRLLTLFLKKLGIQVDYVENGQQAIEHALATDYDLILMDVQMPVMDGMQAVQQLRALGNLTPVIATTANVMHKDIQQYLSMGFDGHLGKPVDRKELSGLLQTFLNRDDDVGDEEDNTLAREIAALKHQYVLSMPQDITKLQQGLAGRDWPSLNHVAHAIKGTSASFELDKVAAVAADLEHAAASEKEEALTLAEKLIEEMVRVYQELHDSPP